MTQRKPVETPKDLSDALDDLFFHLIMNDQEVADEILKEAGYNPDSVGRDLAEAARKALEASPLNWRNKGDLLAERTKQLHNATKPTHRSRAQNESVLNSLWMRLEDRPQGLIVAYRNRSEITDEDFESLVAQVNYLIEQQEKDKK